MEWFKEFNLAKPAWQLSFQWATCKVYNIRLIEVESQSLRENWEAEEHKHKNKPALCWNG